MDPVASPQQFEPDFGLKAVETDLNRSLAELFVMRARQHIHDSYCGIPMLKFPEALRVYEHLLWMSRANCVIEIGALHGGSALWFSDRLAAFAHRRGESFHRVFSIDRNIESAARNLAALDPRYAERISLIAGDVCDPTVALELSRSLPPQARPLIIEDSAHIYETTAAALSHFAELVPMGGFFVVEDGYLDLEIRHAFNPSELCYDGVEFGGILRAIDDWSRTAMGRGFRVRRDLELYGISTTPGGILQRIESHRAE